jgi:uncharacterized protein YdaT
MKAKVIIKGWTKTVSNIEIDGLDHSDYPDFVDAFITDARVDGRQATDEELDQMNNDGEFRYESVESSLY